FLFASPFTDESTGILKLIKEIGFDGVEISLENVGDFDYRETLKALKDNGLVCCSVCGFFTGDRDLRGNQSQQDTSKRYIMECIDACFALECDLLAGPFY
ncbi:hypothetical protein LCGC14_2832320, partial [marine sediment metagenome]